MREINNSDSDNGSSTLTSSNNCDDSYEDTEKDVYKIPKNIWNKIKILKNETTIEPLMLLHMIAWAGSSVATQTLYIERICRLVENFNETVCENLTAYEEEETKVDGTMAVFTLYKGLIEAGFPIIFSLFLGPWSDKHGTKIPLLFPLLGFIISTLITLIFTYFPQISPGYFLIASIPVALTGGMVALVLSAFSFMAQRTTLEKRSFRIAILEGSWFLGSPIGLFIGPKLFSSYGFTALFITACVIYSLAFIYGVFFVNNEKPVSGVVDSKFSLCTDMFNVEAVQDTISTCLKQRKGPRRKWIILLYFAVCMRIFTLFGILNVMYIYTRTKFHWDAKDYAQFQTIDSLIGILGGYLSVIVVLKLFKINDVIIGLFSSIGYCLAAVIFASAVKPWMLYLGTVVQMFCGLITIVIRSMLSKIVSRDELGKIFSFLASLEAGMPILAAPVYSLVFKSTIVSFPGAIFLISASLNGVIFIIFLYFTFSKDKQILETTPEDKDILVENEST